MNAIALILLMTSSLAQLPAVPPGNHGAHGSGMPPMMGQPQGMEMPPPKLEYLAVYASNNETPDFDAKITKYKNVLKKLPFNSFDFIIENQIETPFGEETPFPINGVYASYVIFSPF